VLPCCKYVSIHKYVLAAKIKLFTEYKLLKKIVFFFISKITQQNDDILESIRYVLYVIGQLIHLFFLSFEGQKLIDHSLHTCDKM